MDSNWILLRSEVGPNCEYINLNYVMSARYGEGTSAMTSMAPANTRKQLVLTFVGGEKRNLWDGHAEQVVKALAEMVR